MEYLYDAFISAFNHIWAVTVQPFFDFLAWIWASILGVISWIFFWIFKWVVIAFIYVGLWISDLIAQVFFQVFKTVISFTPLQQIIDSQILAFDPFTAYLLNAIGFYQFLNIVTAAFIYTYSYELLKAGIQFWKFWKA